MRSPSRRTFLQAVMAATAGTLTGTAVYGYAYERRRLELTRVALPHKRLPAALAGFRVGLLSDVHLGPFVPRSLVIQAVDLLLEERPDLIVLGGDFVTQRDRRLLPRCADLLGRLEAPCGIYAVLGNHDDETATPQVLGAKGIRVLSDERALVVARGEVIFLAGVRYWTRRQADLAKLSAGTRGFRILLAHDPRRLAEASKTGFDLVLSGHTHGGQVILPRFGAVGISGRRFPTASGIAQEDDTTVFVTRGLGTVFMPVRLNCPPEVAILTLQRA